MITVLFRAMLALVFITVALVWAAKAEDGPGDFWQRPAIRACCSQADAIYAEMWWWRREKNLVEVEVTGTGPRNHKWAEELIGKRFFLREDQIRREPGNPTGRALLFINPITKQTICYIPGAGI